MRQSQRRLHKIQTEIDTTISSLQRLSLEVNDLIEEELEVYTESENDRTVHIEEIPSSKIDDETQNLSSDLSDPDQTLSLLSEYIHHQGNSIPERRRSRPLSGKKPPPQPRENTASYKRRSIAGPFVLGTFLKITNNYKGRQGTIGRVLDSLVWILPFLILD